MFSVITPSRWPVITARPPGAAQQIERQAAFGILADPRRHRQAEGDQRGHQPLLGALDAQPTAAVVGLGRSGSVRFSRHERHCVPGGSAASTSQLQTMALPKLAQRR